MTLSLSAYFHRVYGYKTQILIAETAFGKFVKKPFEKCSHIYAGGFNVIPKHDHVECINCGGILTDSGWGSASRIFFKDLDHANFYKEHGRLPTLYSADFED